MKKRGISQETLKLIACVTMLIDHIGATVLLQYVIASQSMGAYYAYMAMRAVGRIAFPIYCFLLVEGAHYTRNPKKYALRLAVGALLSEVPFDLAFFGGLTWTQSSVMVTLLLGFGALLVGKKCGNIVLKLVAAVPFALLAEVLGTDYGRYGVLLIAMLGAVRGLPRERLLQTLCLVVMCWLSGGAQILIFGVYVPVELLGVLAMIPISLYSGQKATDNKAVQWGFYLFYPVHITVLYLLTLL